MAKAGLDVHSATVTCPHCDALTSVPLRRMHADVDYYAPREVANCQCCGAGIRFKTDQALVVEIPSARIAPADVLRSDLRGLEIRNKPELERHEFPRIFREAHFLKIDPRGLSKWIKWQDYCHAR